MTTDTSGRQWHPAPWQSAPMNTGSITGLWMAPDEDVDWFWTHTADGKSYVSGYTLKKKAIPFSGGDVFKEKEKIE